MAAPAAAPYGGDHLPPVPEDETITNMANMNRYELKPPFFNGDYGTFEEWKYTFTAYMGLQDNDYTDLLQATEQATAELTELQLRTAASTIEDDERHVRLSTDLRYILINTTSGAAATVCRQYQHTIGFEMYRQLCIRFSIPLGTRSIGHLTRLLKPTFDKNNFEESFSTREFELQRFERDNGQTLPDSVKIAVLLNETSGPLQQHLQLLSGQSPNYARVKQTVIEYYRSTTAFSKLQQLRSQSSSVTTSFGGGQAPKDIDAIHKGKGKYNSYKGKDEEKGTNKGNGSGGYNGYGYNSYSTNYKGKGKYGGNGFNSYNNSPTGFGNPFGRGNKGNKGFSKGYNKGKGKNKGKQATDTCYRCGRTGHYAKECRVAIHNIGQGESNDIEDTTTQWYDDYYDKGWYFQDYTRQQQAQQPLALPPIPPTSSHDMTPIHVIAMISNDNDHKFTTTNCGATDTMHIMIDSGAATHVCPLWFADNYPV